MGSDSFSQDRPSSPIFWVLPLPDFDGLLDADDFMLPAAEEPMMEVGEGFADLIPFNPDEPVFQDIDPRGGIGILCVRGLKIRMRASI